MELGADSTGSQHMGIRQGLVHPQLPPNNPFPKGPSVVGISPRVHYYRQMNLTLFFSRQFLYAHEITYTVSVMLTRISILCFYLRVFPFVVLPALKRVIYVAMVVAVATGIGFSLGFALQCTPVWYNWDWWKNVAHGHCISLNALGWSYGAVNIALDVWIMAIPLPEIHKLRLRSKQRFGVALVFVAWAV